MPGPSHGTAEITQEILFLFQLVEKMERGEILVPRFQRPFVWTHEQVLDLLDSVARRYPIGSILLWRARGLAASDELGPVKVEAAGGGEERLFILDGQQRLITLLGVLRRPEGHPPQEEDGAPDRWLVLYDIDEGRFFHPRSEEERSEPRNFPLASLVDTLTFLKECERLRRDGERGEERVRKVQRLLQAFQTYKLPVITLQRTDLSGAVEIFARLNRKGTRIGPDHMLSALTFREGEEGGFHLSAEMDGLVGDLQLRGFDLDRSRLLRLYLAALHEDPYRSDWTRLPDRRLDELRRRLPEVAGPVREAAVAAADFLRDVIGVPNDRALPYDMQLVLLAAFFYGLHRLGRGEPSPAQRALLERWFWVSSFTAWFASGNPSRVRWLLGEFRDELPRESSPGALRHFDLDEPALPLPERFDQRSARIRTFLLVLLGRGPRRPDGTEIEEPWGSFRERGPASMTPIVDDRQLALYSSPANRLLSPEPRRRRSAARWLLELPEALREDVLASHAIPVEAWERLRAGEPEDFLRLRWEYLQQLEEEFMRGKGVVPPRNRSAPARGEAPRSLSPGGERAARELD